MEEKINGLIYVFENKLNHKLYVGQTINSLRKRINAHFSIAKKFKEQNKNSKFHNALSKYGREGFYVYIIDKSDSIEGLNYKEEKWIQILISPSLFNYRIKRNLPTNGLTFQYIQEENKNVDTNILEEENII